MATSVELYRSGAYEAIDYSEFEVNVGISTRLVAPTASFRTHVDEPVVAGQSARIVVDGTTIFEGSTESGGSKRRRGQVDVTLEHPAAELWNSSVSLTLTGSNTDEQVLQAAINNAGTNASFTLDYVGSATALSSRYEVDNRSVKAVFRDMMDRTDRVWWVDPAGTTIHVEPKGYRGTWQSLDGTSRGVSVESFDSGSVETVRNDVTVVGTGDEAVTGNATDSTSVSDYGRREKTYNVTYAITQTEADDLAAALLQPDPIPEGEVQVASNVGDVTQPLANYTVDLDDDARNIAATGLLVETQTIEQGRATLTVGGGVGESVAEHNRGRKSQGDITAPGSVYNTDRIADDAITSPKLVDTAVIEAKLADAAVATAKLQNNAVINGKLDDLSVSETKIQDDSISTPKLKAGSVTANEIEADTITAAEIAAGTITALEIAADTITASEIAAGTITALEIAAGTITANEIDVLNLETRELFIGADADEGIEFEVDPTFGWVNIVPSGSGAFCQLGTDANPFSAVSTEGLSATNSILAGKDTLSSSGSAAEFAPDGTVQEMAIYEFGGSLAAGPLDDNNGLCGTSSLAWAEMHAYDYIDAGTGSAINDGGDVLAGLAEGHGPPDHARRHDEDGEEVGYSLSAMARSVWDVCREQERIIERQQDAINDLTSRLGTLEARLEALEDPNA